jgi:UDP-glucose 4-epimerase
MPGSILVTGGAGFVGHHLVKKLLEDRESRVIIIDNLSNAKTIPDHEGTHRVSFYQEDIRSRETITDIIKREKVDTCIHLAAKISVDESIDDPFGTVDVNVNGTLSVLDACAKNNISRFIFASSAAVYGETAAPVREDMELNPLSPYGASKIAGEALVKSYKNSGKIPNAVSLRFFNIYGKGQSPEYAGVISKFAEQLSKGLPPFIYGSGNQSRDFVSVDDVVNAIILTRLKTISGTFNIGTGMGTTINELAKKMLKIFKLNLTPLYSNPRKGDIPYSCSDITRAKRFLNFNPRSMLYDTLKELYIASQTTTPLKTMNKR